MVPICLSFFDLFLRLIILNQHIHESHFFHHNWHHCLVYLQSSTPIIFSLTFFHMNLETKSTLKTSHRSLVCHQPQTSGASSTNHHLVTCPPRKVVVKNPGAQVSLFDAAGVAALGTLPCFGGRLGSGSNRSQVRAGIRKTLFSTYWLGNFPFGSCSIHRASGWWFQIFFYFHPYLGKIPILTNIFQMGWNHQLGLYWWEFLYFRYLKRNVWWWLGERWVAA